VWADIVSARPGRTNLGGEVKLQGWLGETNNVSRTARGMWKVAALSQDGGRARLASVPARERETLLQRLGLQSQTPAKVAGRKPQAPSPVPAMPTDLQLDRQGSRDSRSGRYTHHHVCEICESNARDFCTDDRCNTLGPGLVLCEKCSAKISEVPDDQYLAVFRMPLEARKAWKKAK
jgi:hypothetical protein